MTSPNPTQTLVRCCKVFMSERERSDNQDPAVTAGSWCLCLPTSHLGPHQLPSGSSCSCLSLWYKFYVQCPCPAKMEKNTPGFPSAHCAHQVCPAQVFDLMDVEKVWGPEVNGENRKEEKAETRKIIPLFCCSCLLCLVCSLWEGNSDHSPKSQSGTEFELGRCLKCFTWIRWSQLLSTITASLCFCLQSFWWKTG